MGLPEGVPPELRVLTADDWQTWRSIRLEALARAPYAFGSKHADWMRAPEDRWRARLELPESHNLVAFVRAVPVGLATGVLEGGGAELISMYVSEMARGTGVADSLVQGVEDWAREHAAGHLCLNVRAANPFARRLYERHGLIVTGEVDRESPDDPLELRMSKRLAHS